MIISHTLSYFSHILCSYSQDCGSFQSLYIFYIYLREKLVFLEENDDEDYE